jgi:hypothetical protein
MENAAIIATSWHGNQSRVQRRDEGTWFGVHDGA